MWDNALGRILCFSLFCYWCAVFTNCSLGVIYGSVSFTFSVIFRSVNFNMKICWFQCFASGRLHFLTDCTIHKHHVLSRKTGCATILLNGAHCCIYHCSNNRESTAFVPVEFESILFVYCAVLAGFTFLSWFITWHVFSSGYFFPPVMCKTLYLVWNSVLFYI